MCYGSAWYNKRHLNGGTEGSRPTQPAKSVNDFADLLGEKPERAQAAGLEIWEQTKADVVLVTVPSLGGSTIEDYALALFRHWGLGDNERTTAFCCLWTRKVAQGQPGKVRIEVGYGLEGPYRTAKPVAFRQNGMPLWMSKVRRGD